ncbi:MAG: hypothetical protein JWO79_587 [Actinomycetia bacterium]|jgi:hypothetical protein|nr:hypothetical protein [Actinomycetes bacterium]
MSADSAPVTSLSWRVEPKRVAARATAAAGLAIVTALLARDLVTLTVGILAAAAAAGFAIRDVLVPVRLTADTEGVTLLRGVAGRRTIRWRDVERVRVDTRDRLGLRQSALEIDEGHALHLLTAADLGADPHDVAAAITQLRTGR